MNYLLDKKEKRKKFSYVFFLIIACLVLVYFRSGIFNGLSYASNIIFRPVLVLGGNVGEKLKSTRSYFLSKNSLLKDNEDLKIKLNEQEARITNHNSILVENISLKEILGRKDTKMPVILSAILSKPNQSPYDTLVIDVGMDKEIEVGDTVFALGDVPIGRISNVYANSSKAILFSNSGEKTQVVIGEKNIFMEIVGRGGGNFEMAMPRDFILKKGDEISLPGIMPHVLGIVETILSDPRDSFIKVLLVSPVNIQELKFVEVEQKK